MMMLVTAGSNVIMSSSPLESAIVRASRRVVMLGLGSMMSPGLLTVKAAGTSRASSASRPSRVRVVRERPAEAAGRRKEILIGLPSIGEGVVGDWGLGLLERAGAV